MIDRCIDHQSCLRETNGERCVSDHSIRIGFSGVCVQPGGYSDAEHMWFFRLPDAIHLPAGGTDGNANRTTSAEPKERVENNERPCAASRCGNPQARVKVG